MKQKNSARGAAEPVVSLCQRCRHPESEHGRNGSRPCMSVVGELEKREFCSCDEFVTKTALAA